MNERIKELARQADAWAREIVTDLREIPVYNRIRDEKFAQLIVKECAEVVKTHLLDRPYLANTILQHFGVEE